MGKWGYERDLAAREKLPLRMKKEKKKKTQFKSHGEVVTQMGCMWKTPRPQFNELIYFSNDIINNLLARYGMSGGSVYNFKLRTDIQKQK